MSSSGILQPALLNSFEAAGQALQGVIKIWDVRRTVWYLNR